MPRNPTTFRLAARNIFLTYPRCPIPKQQALDQLSDLFNNRKPNFILVAQEIHEDGQPHLHALLQFPSKFETQNCRFFDLVSLDGRSTFHPNAQAARDEAAVRDYVAKHNDVVSSGEFRRSSRHSDVARRDDVYSRVIAAGDKDTAMELIRVHDPYNFVTNNDKLQANLNRIFMKPKEPYRHSYPAANNVPDELRQWAETNIRPRGPADSRPISLILEGPSRSGKTCWARSLGHHNYYMGHIDLKNHDDHALYNVIDDVNPQYLKHWKEFIGAQFEWTSNCKYAKPRTVKGGIPCIVVCNQGDGASYKSFLDKPGNEALREWTLKNALFFFMEEQLFFSSPGAVEEAETPQHQQTAS